MADKTDNSNERRCFNLEYRLIKTTNQLTVITTALEDFLQGEEIRSLDNKSASFLFGTMSLLEEIAAGCARAVDGE